MAFVCVCVCAVAGLPRDKLVEAHGSFSTALCTRCSREHCGDDVKVSIVVMSQCMMMQTMSISPVNARYALEGRQSEHRSDDVRVRMVVITSQ